MSKRGTYKYICEECYAENWLSIKDRGSRFQPHCTSCGSLRLEPSHRSTAADKLAKAHDAMKDSKDIMDKKMNKK